MPFTQSFLYLPFKTELMRSFFMLCNAFFLTISLNLFSQQPDWNNPKIFSLNEGPLHAGFYHCPNVPLALGFDRNTLPWVMILNGGWQFLKVQSPVERPVEFPLPDFDASKWNSVRYPFEQSINKTLSGFPTIPKDDNPVLSYRKIFPIPETWYGQQIFVRFEGVSSACYVWLNGQKIGYTETGETGAEFNVTPYIKFGLLNTLAVQTYTWSDASWLFPLDSIKQNGIFNYVYMYEVPNLAVGNFHDSTAVQGTMGHFFLDIYPKRFLKSIRDKFFLHISLFDNSGKSEILSFEREFKPSRKSDSLIYIEGQIPSVKLWDLDTPYLYKLVISLKDKENNLVEAVAAKVAFGKDSLLQNTMNINGLEVLPANLSLAQARELVKGLQKRKVKVVFTGDNLLSPEILDFFDETGIELIENIPFSHDRAVNAKLGSTPEWGPIIMNYAEKMKKRDENHPCVLRFAIDENLSGPNFDAVRRYLKVPAIVKVK